MLENLIILMFWPFCCLITMMITVPVVKRAQQKNPDYDGRLFILTTLIGVTTAMAWLQWGREDEAAAS